METSTAPDPYFVERRKYDRIPNHFDVDIIVFSGNRAGDQVTGKVINISQEGVGAVLRYDIPEGTSVELTVYSDQEQSAGSGEVIWRKEVKGRTVHGIKISRWSYLDPSIQQELPH